VPRDQTRGREGRGDDKRRIEPARGKRSRPDVHRLATVAAVEVLCESRGEPLELLQGDEMGSANRRYRCQWCGITYERDASGLVVEIGQ
jgi:hypothetical protein